MTCSCWAKPLISRLYHKAVSANVHHCESFLIFNVHDKFCYPWRMAIQMRLVIQSSATASQLPFYRSYGVIIYGVIIYVVITCHENVYANKSWENRVTAVCKVSVFVLSWRNDWYAIWPTWVIHQVGSFTLTSDQIFNLTYWGQHAYVLIRLDAANTMVLSISLYLF